MSIQVYESKDKGLDGTSGALVLLPNGQQITEAEQEKRIKDAEELEKKLQFITEKVPTRIMNVAGSNAGAGSGEFHMYRMARRREMMRLQRIEEQDKEQAAEREYEREVLKRQNMQERKQKLLEEDEARTAKRRQKRQKKKGKKKAKISSTGGNGTGDAATTRAAESSDESEGVQQAALD